MNVSIRVGDIADAATEAICTSTNPRLTLMMGTGAAVRERGGWDVLRACETILEEEFQRTGRRYLRPGSAVLTKAGTLPFKAIIHCVASNSKHLSSPEIIRLCVTNALERADAVGVVSLAMPVFGAGHAHVKFEKALTAIAESLRDATTEVQDVVVVVLDPEREEDAKRIVCQVLPGA